MNELEENFKRNRKTTIKKKLGPDHFDIRVTDGKWMTVKIIEIKEFYKPLLIRYGR